MTFRTISNLQSKLLFGLALIKARITGKRIPLIANFILTNRCNLKCFYCYVDTEHSKGEELELNKVLKLIDILYDKGTRLIVLLGGEPGVGKSTLLLEVGSRLSKKDKTLYVSAEESPQQVSMRAKRLGSDKDNLYVLGEDNLQDVYEYIKESGFKFVIAQGTRTVQISAINPSRTDTRIFRLKNADPLNIKRLLEEEISDIGRIQINRDTNSLIITDTFSNFNKIIELINAMDIEIADETTLGQVEITDAGKEVVTNVFVCRYVEAVQLKEILIKLVTEGGAVEADPFSNSLVVKWDC